MILSRKFNKQLFYYLRCQGRWWQQLMESDLILFQTFFIMPFFHIKLIQKYCVIFNYFFFILFFCSSDILFLHWRQLSLLFFELKNALCWGTTASSSWCLHTIGRLSFISPSISQKQVENIQTKLNRTLAPAYSAAFIFLALLASLFAFRCRFSSLLRCFTVSMCDLAFRNSLLCFKINDCEEICDTFGREGNTEQSLPAGW